MSGEEPIVVMRDIAKIYPDGTAALRGVNFETKKGEIHGLLGENGAGKTTLTKILSGILQPTKGEIFVQGRRVHFKSPADALRLGIGMVHQHFALVPTFTAVENITFGQARSLVSPLSLQDGISEISRLIEEVGLKVPLDRPVELMPVGVQQRVEILKMLYRHVDILILDEPTSALAPLEVNELFRMLRHLKTLKKTAILITHKLKEVLEITDHITVLRQGKVSGLVETAKATPEGLARMMVGRDVVFALAKGQGLSAAPVLQVKDLSAKDDAGRLVVKEVSFEVKSGEIFGVAGVEGNGQTELVEALTGLRPLSARKLLIKGSEISRLTPRVLQRIGVAHVPEDRRRMGLILDMNVAENSILGLHRNRTFLGRFYKMVWHKIHSHAANLVTRFEITTPGVTAPAKSLSGGNQQKLVVSRELSKTPSLIIAAQPTRGLDVAATEYIRRLLLDLRATGKGILLVSADLDEVLQVADRVAVMYEGRFVGIVEPELLSREKIGMMMGGIEVTL